MQKLPNKNPSLKKLSFSVLKNYEIKFKRFNYKANSLTKCFM